MRYDYMKERPNIYQPSQNGVDSNPDFSSFKKNRSTNSKSLLSGGGHASRNRSTYGRPNTLSTRQSINKYPSTQGVAGSGLSKTSGPGGACVSRSGSSVFNTSAGSRSGGFSILNVHDEDEDDEVLEKFGRLEENEEETNDWRSYYNGDEDDDDDNESNYRTNWRDLDDYDYDKKGDDVFDDDEEEEDTYHQQQQQQNSLFVAPEPGIHLVEDNGVYKSSWITDSDDDYNPDFDENKIYNYHSYKHDNQDDGGHDNNDDNKVNDEVDFNTLTTDLKQDYLNNGHNNDVKASENNVEILESIIDLKAMLPDVNDETGNNHNKFDLIKNNDEGDDDDNHKTKKTNEDKLDKEKDEHAFKEQNDAVPLKVPISNIIKCPPQENKCKLDKEDDNMEKNTKLKNEAPQTSILKTPSKQSKLQKPLREGNQSPVSQARTVYFAASHDDADGEDEEDYEDDDEDDNENEKQDVFKKPFLYNNYSNRQRQYSKYQQQQQQDLHKRYISNNLKQQQQQQPIENWRQRNSNQQDTNVYNQNLKNFKNLDNQTYRKYRPNNGDNYYGNQHRNYLGSFSHSGTQQQPLPTRSNPYMLPNYYHQHNNRHNSNSGSGNSSGGTPPSDHEGNQFKSSPNSGTEIRNWRNDSIYSSVRNCNMQPNSPTLQMYQQRKCFSQQPQMQPLYRVNPHRIGSGRFPANNSNNLNYPNNSDYNETPLSIGLSPPSESLLLQRRLQRMNNNMASLSSSPPKTQHVPPLPTHYHQQLQRNGNDLLINNSNEYCQQQATASG